LLTANWSRIDKTDGAELERGPTEASKGTGGWGYIFRKDDPTPTTVG